MTIAQYPDYSSTFSSGRTPPFNPDFYTGSYPGVTDIISRYNAPPATKPGTDWLALGAGISDLFGGIGDLARGIQGLPATYRPAGSRLQEYLQSQKEDTYLKDLLSAILTTRAKDYGSFEPKSSKSGL